MKTTFAAFVALGAMGLTSCSHDTSDPATPTVSGAGSTPATTAPVQPAASAVAAGASSPSIAMSPPVAASAASAPDPAPDVKLAPMKIAFDVKGASLELMQDGGVWANGIVVMGTAASDYVGPAGKKGVRIGSITKNQLAIVDRNRGATAIIAIWKDATLTNTDSEKKAKFDDKNDLALEGGARISIDDNGRIDVTNPDGTRAIKSPPTVVGYQRDAKRTAMLLTILYLEMQSRGVEPQAVEQRP